MGNPHSLRSMQFVSLKKSEKEMRTIHHVLLMSLVVTCVSVYAFGKGLAPRSERLLDRLNNASDDYVMVSAHRGDWRNAPENSLQAIQNCIDMGVDIVEVDLRTTKDGQLILMHDKTLGRTTTGSGSVADSTLAELSELRLLNGYGIATHHRIPTLEEAMSVAKGKILVYLDKSYECIDEAYEILENTGTVDHAIFYGSEPVEQVCTDYGELYDKIHYMPKINGSPSHTSDYIEDFVSAMKPKGFLVHFDKEESSAVSLIPAIKKHNIRVWASPLWSEICAGHTDDVAVHDPDAAWGWLIERGANILCTDRPALMLEYLRARGLHD